MTSRYPRAFLLSAGGHAVVVLALVVGAYLAMPRRVEIAPATFVLTASDGRVSGASLATGASGPSFAQQLEGAVRRAEAAAREEARRERIAATLAPPSATKSGQKTPGPAAVVPPRPNIARINTEELVRGVMSPTLVSVDGGEQEQAHRTQADGVDSYIAALKRQLRDVLAETPGLDEGLSVEVELRILADGRLTVSRIIAPSREAAFDRAVLRVIAALRMPPRPAGLGERQTITISTRARP